MLGEQLNIKLYIQKENRMYEFTVPYGSAYEEVYSVMNEFNDHIKKMEEKSKAASAQKETEQPKEEVKHE